MTVLKPLIMAFSCFSAIPMPQVEWDERGMRHMMTAFPAVGAAIGIILWLWTGAADALGLGSLAIAAGYTLIPLAVTGGIHMDGFADVVDARSSHAEPARKQQILKDPHIGAFAAMGVGTYLIAYLALASEVARPQLPALFLMPVLSRCLSAYAVTSLAPARADGMYASEHKSGTNGVRITVLAIFCLTAGILAVWRPLTAALVAATAILCLAYVVRMAKKEFGGMSGDLCGYYLQLTELAMLTVVVLVGRLV